jgi:hypothetical protein
VRYVVFYFVVVVVSDPPTRLSYLSCCPKKTAKRGACGLSPYLDNVPKLVCKLD